MKAFRSTWFSGRPRKDASPDSVGKLPPLSTSSSSSITVDARSASPGLAITPRGGSSDSSAGSSNLTPRSSPRDQSDVTTLSVPAAAPSADLLPPGHGSIRILPILVSDDTGQPSQQSETEVACIIENFALRHGSLFWPQMMRSVDIHKGDRAALESTDDCDILHVCGEPWPPPMPSAPKEHAPLDSATSRRPSRSGGGRDEVDAESSLSSWGSSRRGSNARSHRFSFDDEAPATGGGKDSSSSAGGYAGGDASSARYDSDGEADALPPSPYHSDAVLGLVERLAARSPESAPAIAVLNTGMTAHFAAKLVAAVPSLHVIAWATPVETEGCLEFTASFYQALPDILSAELVEFGKTSVSTAMVYSAYHSALNRMRTRGYVALDPTPYVRKKPREAMAAVALPAAAEAAARAHAATTAPGSSGGSGGGGSATTRPAPGDASHESTHSLRGGAHGPHKHITGGATAVGGGGGGGANGVHPPSSSSSSPHLELSRGTDGSQATSFLAFTSTPVEQLVCTVRDANGRTLRPYGVPVFVTSLEAAHGRIPAFSMARLLKRSIISQYDIDAAVQRHAIAVSERRAAVANGDPTHPYAGVEEHGTQGGVETDCDILSDAMRLIRMAPPASAISALLRKGGSCRGLGGSSSVAGIDLEGRGPQQQQREQQLFRARPSTADGVRTLPAAAAGISPSDDSPPSSSPLSLPLGSSAVSSGVRPISAFPFDSGAALQNRSALPPSTSQFTDLDEAAATARRSFARASISGDSVGGAQTAAAAAAAAEGAGSSSSSSSSVRVASSSPAPPLRSSFADRVSFSERGTAPRAAVDTAAAAVDDDDDDGDSVDTPVDPYGVGSIPFPAPPSSTRSSICSTASFELSLDGVGASQLHHQHYPSSAASSASAAALPMASPTSAAAASRLPPAAPRASVTGTAAVGGRLSRRRAALARAASARSPSSGLVPNFLTGLNERLSDYTAAVDISLDRSLYDSDAAAQRETIRLLKFVETGLWRASTASRPAVMTRSARGQQQQQR